MREIGVERYPVLPCQLAIRLQPKERVAAVDWWHTIDLGDGIITPGRSDSRWRLENMHLPAS